MDFDRPWKPLDLDEEIRKFGAGSICDAHNEEIVSLCIEIGRRRTENGHLTARVNYLESTQCTVDKEGKCARGERMAANAAELAQRMAREVDRLRTELADKDELIREAMEALEYISRECIVKGAERFMPCIRTHKPTST